VQPGSFASTAAAAAPATADATADAATAVDAPYQDDV
jgi:hypothetical protein